MDAWTFCWTMAMVVFGQRMPHPVDPDAVIRLPESTHLRYAPPGPGLKSRATVLFWTPCYDDRSKWFWWYRRSFVQDLCPELVRRCDFTIDQTRLNDSDAVVFMVYGNSFDLSGDVRSQLPPHRLPHQRWIFLSLEPPTLVDSRGNMSKLNGMFNWTMSHRRDSDIYSPFGTLVLTRSRSQSQSQSRDYSMNKTKMAAWFVSHCDTEGRREAFVAELQKHLQVDVYGRCGTLECQPPMSDECYKTIGQRYKFYLAFENILCRDYVTEKLMLALASDVVPVVFGGADYALYAPAGSYVDALSFPDPRSLAAYLVFLDGDHVEYNRFFDWKRGYEVRVLQHGVHVCNLCSKVLQAGLLPDNTYDDIDGWWRAGAECRGWTPVSNASGSGP